MSRWYPLQIQRNILVWHMIWKQNISTKRGYIYFLIGCLEGAQGYILQLTTFTHAKYKASLDLWYKLLGCTVTSSVKLVQTFQNKVLWNTVSLTVTVTDIMSIIYHVSDINNRNETIHCCSLKICIVTEEIMKHELRYFVTRLLTTFCVFLTIVIFNTVLNIAIIKFTIEVNWHFSYLTTYHIVNNEKLTKLRLATEGSTQLH